MTSLSFIYLNLPICNYLIFFCCRISTNCRFHLHPHTHVNLACDIASVCKAIRTPLPQYHIISWMPCVWETADVVHVAWHFDLMGFSTPGSADLWQIRTYDMWFLSIFTLTVVATGAIERSDEKREKEKENCICSNWWQKYLPISCEGREKGR